ncbi:hypothetical protein PG990_003014 [Apiospora arundinis]
MQFARVNPRTDLALALPIKPPVKQHVRPKPQHPPKSSPPDPEDLRRRLYIVLSEQNAQREARRLRTQKTNNGAMDPPITGPAAAPGGDVDATVTSVYTRKSATTTSFAARAAAATSTAGTAPAALNVVIAPPRADANRGSHGSSNNKGQNLRRADSKMDATGAAKDVKRSKSSSSSKAKKSAPTANGAAKEQEQHHPAEPYHHVPQVAAQQFARTATAKASLGDMSSVHPLSRQALKFHIEGSAAERTELEASKTPGEQKRALRRAQSTREKLQERNQFQNDLPPAAVATAIPPRNKRHSLPADGFAVSSATTGSLLSSSLPDNRNHHHQWNWANMGDIVEDAANDDNYHYQSGEFSPTNTTHPRGSHGRRRRPFNFADLMPGCRPVDADGVPLVLRNNAAIADRQVDWTQKDEKNEKLSSQQPRHASHSHDNNHNSSTSKVPRSPLLRKADSLWALKGKLVSVSSGRKHHHGDSNNSSSNKTSRNSANSSETGMTSPIKSPSRGGFFSRLRRLS